MKKDNNSSDQVTFPINDSKRRFLLTIPAVGAGFSAACVSTSSVELPELNDKDELEFELSRADDRFYARLKARNTRLGKIKGEICLIPICQKDTSHSSGVLEFIFPPQIFTETAIPIEEEVSFLLDSDPDTDKYEKLLDKIELIPGKEAKLVFRIPRDIEYVPLRIESLLEWDKFEYLVEDLSKVSDLGEQGKHKRHFIGFDWFNDPELKDSSAIELPWGINLQPLGVPNIDFEWRHSNTPKTINGRTELWFSSIESPYGRHRKVPFEVLDVRGMKTVDYSPDTNSSSYEDSNEYSKVKQVVECSPVTNFDRLEIAASLSRRFEYTGNPQTNTSTASLRYNGSETNACYESGRSISVTTFGISSLGGWLSFDSEWNPEAGCALKGWSHETSLGRDHKVKFQRAGFLYPFGIPAELVILTEREFVRDKDGHYVAPLLKRAFIQIPKPNTFELEHLETPFAAISVSTLKTPPLDLPPSKNFIEYAMCDYFLPIVDGQPFKFEHIGIDHVGNEFTSSMPMFFVSNKARNTNGLISEKAGGTPLSCQNVVDSIFPRRALVNCLDDTSSAFQPAIPAEFCENEFVDSNGDGVFDWEDNLKQLVQTKLPSTCRNFDRNGLGIRQLDQDWLSYNFRFSKYNGQQIALAPQSSQGDTTQEVEWVEWVRGKVPDPSLYDGVALRPFIPRARTMKIALQGLSQFSGSSRFLMVTYRDTRFQGHQILDPEPTVGELYDSNIFDPDSECNTVGAYLGVLPLDDIHVDRQTDTNDRSRLEFIRQLYYADTLPEYDLPPFLFENLEVETQFGIDGATDSLGGIATPDSPVSILTRQNGPMGDNTFDPKKWKEARGLPDDKCSSSPNPGECLLKIQEGRAFYLDHRNPTAGGISHFYKNLVDGLYDPLPTHAYPLCSQSKQNKIAETKYSFQESPKTTMAGITYIASLFGLDAEIIPGVRLVKILEGAGLDLDGQQNAFRGFNALNDSSKSKEISSAPKWDFKVNGLEEILALFGSGPGQIPLSEAVTLFSNAPVIDEPGQPLKFGVEASLDWSTEALSVVDLGVIEFVPAESVFSMSAVASMDFLEGKPLVSARAELTDFHIIVFSSLDAQFRSVSFTLDTDGNKSFDPEIGVIEFAGALSFINNIKDLLKTLEDKFGISIDLKPSAVSVSQVIAIPPAAEPGKQGGSFALGPVLISNLNLWWKVRIPLIGRDVLTVAFGLATREDPLTVYIPPFYGGKSHALMEVTTKGLRLFEVSIEFGGIIRIDYSIATGEVSLMAGNYFMIAKDRDAGTETFVLSAYVKVVGDFVVAGFIDASLVIMISLTYEKTNGGQNSGEVIAGQASVTVSIKIGFVRISYRFTAREEQRISKGNQSTQGQSSLAAPAAALFEQIGNALVPSANASEHGDLNTLQAKNVFLFDPESRSNERWGDFVDAYASEVMS